MFSIKKSPFTEFQMPRGQNLVAYWRPVGRNFGPSSALYLLVQTSRLIKHTPLSLILV